MASHTCRTKSNARKYASRMRDRGFNANIYPLKTKKGWGVSVTRK